MNVERGLRRLLVLVTLVLVLVVVGWRVLLSLPQVTCMYLVILADGALVRVPAPQGDDRGANRGRSTAAPPRDKESATP